VEYRTMLTLLEGGKSNLEGESIPSGVQDIFDLVLGAWSDSTDKVLQPADYPYKDTREERDESIRRGYALFTNTQGSAACISCHLDFGRQVNFRYDDWGTLVRPANLTAGIYRGGRRPVDLYWRIRGGIPGAQMPANDSLKSQGGRDDFWDVVNFVQALPYPEMLPDDVKAKVYPPPPAPESSARQHAAAR